MAANQPCAEDLIPKNRQNNVYGHGHVEALAAVMEAAQRDYQLDTSITISITTEVGIDDRIHLLPGDAIEVDLSGDVDTFQWRSNHLRDDWANLHTFDEGDEKATLDLTTIVHQLEHLPGIEVEGNHTLSLRGLIANESGGHSSSSLVSVNVMLMDTANAKSYAESNGDGLFGDLPSWVGPVIILFLVVLVILGMIVINKVEGAAEVEVLDWSIPDEDIDAVVVGHLEAETLD